MFNRSHLRLRKHLDQKQHPVKCQTVNNHEFTVWEQGAESETEQAAVCLPVCVHARKASINHHGGWGGGSVCVCVTQRGAEGGVKDEGMAEHKGLGGWMLKRDCGEEDLHWEAEGGLGSELSGDAITELRAEKETQRDGRREEMDYHDY